MNSDILTRKQTQSENGKVTPMRNQETTVRNQPQQPKPVLSSLTVHHTRHTANQYRKQGTKRMLAASA